MAMMRGRIQPQWMTDILHIASWEQSMRDFSAQHRMREIESGRPTSHLRYARNPSNECTGVPVGSCIRGRQCAQVLTVKSPQTRRTDERTDGGCNL